MKQLLRSVMTAMLLLLSLSAAAKDNGGTFSVGDKTFLLNGKPFVVKAAEVHYPRIPRPYWEHRIKMCKALGMNTLCLYIFWNIHEQREGQFDFTGNNDVAEFCRLAQKNGMYVIVRPGPYVCAEWEMGGLPWWLLKKKDIRLREQDPYFMERVEIFERKVAEQLAPMTIQRGGPIVMVQVENEYGSYGEDKPYVAAIRDMVRKYWSAKDANGNSVDSALTLFQCDWASNFTRNGLDDLVWTMNFGTGANIDSQFKRLGELRPNSPKMCSEFWSGWFDKWGARHETRLAKAMVDGIDEMLSKGISFSLYMTHGGTSFGHWAGANSPGFAPDVTSYDYDAPINEYGQATEKFWQLRKTLQKYSGKSLPKLPASPASIISVPRFELTEFAPLLNGADSMAEGCLTFEEMDMGWGTMAYEVTLPATHKPSVMTLNGHDYTQVFIGRKFVGKADRVKNERGILIPALDRPTRATIVVEGMGRINFGRAIKDFKGLIGDVTLTVDDEVSETTYRLKDFTSVAIPDSYEQACHALSVRSGGAFTGQNNTRVGYYRGYFNLRKTGDTFLNMEAFGKGLVYVNGHALGRFWHIGPQQTLYVPGCWLKKGRNEIVVLDVVGPYAKPEVFGQDKPELDKLNLEKSRLHNNPGDKLDLNSDTPVASGELKPGNGWQTIKFGSPAKGRLVTIVAESTQKGDAEVAIAEIYAHDANGKRMSREQWTVKYADSEDIMRGNNTADKVFDLQESTYWQTARGTSLPHRITIDLGSEQTVTAIDVLPRAEQGAPGAVKGYKVYIR